MIAARTWRTELREWVPPRLRRLYARQSSRIRYAGRFDAWPDALRDATGYDAPEILAAVRVSALAARDGRAACDRDGVAFADPQPTFPLLTGLLQAALAEGRLSVLDFGGALGSTYRQCKSHLAGIDDFAWSVVEQPHFVACGRREFQTNRLRFYDDVTECLDREQPNVLLLSGVLSYLEEPYSALKQLLRAKLPHVLIDRTPVIEGSADRLTIQQVPAAIYGTRVSYPAWMFSRARLLETVGQDYQVTAEFDALAGTIDLGDELARDRGWLCRLRDRRAGR